jgi:arabinofuranosyltransferase
MKKVKKQTRKSKSLLFFRKYRKYIIQAVVFLLILIYTAILIKTAWVCDDAYITFRTIDNFIHGYGLTWNVVERVQVYTHPLWMFILSFFYFFTREIFFTSVFLSIIISVVTVYLFAQKISKHYYFTFLGIILLILSKSFTDYSTSGLENPLSHLLLVLFLIFYLPEKHDNKNVFLISLFAALGILNRMDTVFIYLPAILYYLIKIKRLNSIKYVIYGFSVFIVWEIFSLFYYGFLFPNTYYAKMKNIEIPKGELFNNGLKSFDNSFNMDPVTLITIAACFLFFIYILIIQKHRQGKNIDKKEIKVSPEKFKYKNIPLIAGIILHLLYILYIGGDFMSGRFFSVPLLFSILVISSMQIHIQKIFRIVFIAFSIFIICIGLLSPFNPVLSDVEYRYDDNEKKLLYDKNGINDERGFYYRYSNLLDAFKGKKAPDHKWVDDAEEVKKYNIPFLIIRNIGYHGYFSGPGTYLLDELSLSDPFLARLPRAKYDANGKSIPYIIGHYPRQVPKGYIKTRFTGQNYFKDEKLYFFYTKIKIITEGSLFDWDRICEIIKMNLGYYDDYIDKDIYCVSPDGTNSYTNISLLTEVVEVFPEHWIGYSNRGNLFFSKNELDKAYDDVNKTITIAEEKGIRNSNMILMYYDRGCIYHRRKDLTKAKADLQTALDIRKENLAKKLYVYQYDHLLTALQKIINETK